MGRIWQESRGDEPMQGTVLGSRRSLGCNAEAAALLDGLIESGAVSAVDQGPLLVEATSDALRLVCTERGGPGKLQIEMDGPAARRRLQTHRSDPLARAVGMRKGPAPYVIDATCGMGRDSLSLLGLGCRVVALERHPVVSALLQDAVRRARKPPVMELLEQRFRLVCNESATFLQSLGVQDLPAVVLLDPMYPGGPRKALPGGDTQILQRLVPPGNEEEELELLRIARAAATERVVVKRPRKSPPLGGLSPRSSHGSRATRYDVYAPTQGR